MKPTKRARVSGYAAPGEPANTAPAPVPEGPALPAATDEMLDTAPEKADTRRQMKAKAKSRPKPSARKSAPKRKTKRASSKSKSSTKLSSPSASKRLPGQPAKSRR